MTKVEENIFEITCTYCRYAETRGTLLMDSMSLKQALTDAAYCFETTQYNKEQYLDEIDKFASKVVEELYETYGPMAWKAERRRNIYWTEKNC